MGEPLVPVVLEVAVMDLQMLILESQEQQGLAAEEAEEEAVPEITGQEDRAVLV